MNEPTQQAQNETINAYCDCCNNQAVGTEQQLENSGWYCGSREQFCPDCN